MLQFVHYHSESMKTPHHIECLLSSTSKQTIGDILYMLILDYNTVYWGLGSPTSNILLLAEAGEPDKQYLTMCTATVGWGTHLVKQGAG